MTDRLLITGLGAISPLGIGVAEHAPPRSGWVFSDIDVASSQASASAPHAALGIPEAFSIKDYVTAVGLRRKKRFSQLAMAAAVDAFSDACLDGADLDRVGMVASTEYGPQRVVSEYLDGLVGGGLAEASPGLFTQTVYNVATGQASLALGLRGANSTLVGGSAIAYAAALLSTSKADAAFALSLDETNEIMTSYFDAEAATTADDVFPFRTGEAAAVAVLETPESAEDRGATAFAELLGTASASAPGRGVTYLEWSADDDTIEHAMRGALRAARVGIDEIGLVVATGNGLDGLTRSEFAAVRSLGYAGALAYPRLVAGECFGGNEALAYVLGLGVASPGTLVLLTVSTANGGVTSTVVRALAVRTGGDPAGPASSPEESR